MRAVYHSSAARGPKAARGSSTQRRSLTVVNIGTESEVCFKASCRVVADVRRNSEPAGANTFLSGAFYRLNVVARVLNPSSSSLSLTASPSVSVICRSHFFYEHMSCFLEKPLPAN